MNFTNPTNAPYDAWLHWNVTRKCNFDCEYCFSHDKATTADATRKIDVEKLLSVLSETGKTFRVGFTGGEPFLIPNFPEAARALTEKHFVSINTHLTSSKIKEFAEAISPEKVLFIQASVHFDELEKRNLRNRFAENYNLLKERGFNVFAEAVAFPPFISRLNEFRDFYGGKGIDFSFGAFIGIYDGKKYPESYSDEEISTFGLDKSEQEKFLQKGNPCNAGFNAAVVFSNGNVFPCFQIKEKIGNVYERINFYRAPITCPARRCGCPLNVYDEYLFRKAPILMISKRIK